MDGKLKTGGLSFQSLLLIGVAILTQSSEILADTGSVTVVKPVLFGGATNPGALLQISPTYPGLGGCTNAPGQFVFISYAGSSLPNGRDLYDAAFAGFLAGHTLTFGTSGCSPDGAYPLVTAVGIDQ